MRIPFISYKSLLALGAALLLTGPSAFADNPPEISESIQSGIAPLAKLYEEKKWVEAVKAIDVLLAKADPNSFDRAFLSGYKAQLVYATGDTAGTIPPLETMLRIADQQKLFRFARLLPVGEADTLSTLANLYMQQAAVQGATPDEQRAAYAKAHDYAKRLISVPKPSADGQFLWARILYSEATVNTAAVDMTLMKQAVAEAEKALLLTIKPKEEYYLLLLAGLQQLGEYVRCADLLELMVKQFPNNKSAWPMLFQTYLAVQNMPGKEKDYEISALVALERAQAVGLMSTNKDNFTLAGLYYNIQQYQFAADILSKGLKNGKIDPEQKNFELLAACYQQIGKDDLAIEVYLQAIKTFPKSASLEQQIGQMYYNIDKRDEALKHLQAAVTKGLEKPVQTLILVSYLALELKRLDEALVAAEKAVAADAKNKDAQNILGVIKDSIKEREQFKKQK